MDGYAKDGYDGYQSLDGYNRLTYFDAKRELKKIYSLCQRAIQRKDEKYINFLLLSLDGLEDALKTKFNIDVFGLHVLKKEISGMRHFITTKLKKKKAEYEKMHKLHKLQKRTTT